MDAPYDRDREHLKLLGILHYVWAALGALQGLLGIVYALMGPAIGGWIRDDMARQSRGGPPPEQFATLFTTMFVGVGILLFVFGIGGCVLSIVAARSLHAYRRRTLCMIAAGFDCLSVPLGTALGVFTLIVLSRPTVRALFEQNDSTPRRRER